MMEMARRKLALLLVLATGAVVGAGAFGLAHSSASSSKNPPSAAAGSLLPAIKLPASSGFAGIRGMSQLLSSRIPLWTGKDGAGPYTASAYGLTGSLGQGFVISTAIAKYGTLDSRPGLPLPLPLSFANLHPGPAEVFDSVWAFANSWAAAKLLHDPVFADTDVSGVSAEPSGSLHGGLAWKVVSAANGGLREFRFEWAAGSDLVMVSVAGARLTLKEAQTVAARAGS